MSFRRISEATGIGKTVVGEYVRRAGVIGITWPVPEDIDDAELERRLFPVPGETAAPRAAIDWRQVHEEMKRRSVTLVLLWQEYRAEQVDGYGYSRFCDLYGEWRKTISATMRQTHPAGERLFVDYAGDTVPVFDQITNAERPAHIFVAALGASNYTYAEARWSEGLGDWVSAHVNALATIGGVPKVVAREWMQAREAELLAVPYFHIVFTLPGRIADIAYQNKAVIYDLLFKPPPRPCARSQPTPSISAPASASPRCCTPGARP
jgi:transposase